jgi:hypothetical protein
MIVVIEGGGLKYAVMTALVGKSNKENLQTSA